MQRALQLSSSCSDTQQECPFESGQPWKRHGNASPCLLDKYAGRAEVRAVTRLSWLFQTELLSPRQSQSTLLNGTRLREYVRSMTHILWHIPTPKAGQRSRPDTEQQPYTWNDLMPCSKAFHQGGYFPKQKNPDHQHELLIVQEKH